jgi:hypothetical protein
VRSIVEWVRDFERDGGAGQKRADSGTGL